MLKSLSVSNFILIEQIFMEFEPGLNIITGESGAGKSSIMQALTILLGERMDRNYAKNLEKPIIIEAVFNIQITDKFLHIFEQNEIECQEELIIRKEIKPSKKSRVFLNDQIISLKTLRNIVFHLLDLHQQFNTLLITEQDYQINVLDQFCNQTAIVHDFQTKFANYKIKKAELQTLIETQQKYLLEKELNEFLFNEINSLKLIPQIIEQKEQELLLIDNALMVKESCNKASSTLKDGQHNAITQIKVLIQLCQQINKFLPQMKQLNDRLEFIYEELKDLSNEFTMLESTVIFNDEKKNKIHDFLNLCFALYKKHKVQTTSGLIEVKDNLEKKLSQVQELDQIILKNQTALAEQLNQLLMEAQKISEKRTTHIPILENKVNEALKEIGMEKAGLKVALNAVELNEMGLDKVSFLFRSNQQSQFEELGQIASGGELSRLMLCLKTILAENSSLPTLIFDEIDSGVSGETARKMARLIEKIGRQTQTILITHLPQIASLGQHHYSILKTEIEQKMVTTVEKLSKEARIIVLAQMMSGQIPTENALALAKELLNY